MTSKRATELRMLVEGLVADQLADGSWVLRVSIQTKWVYVKLLRRDGRFVTRRYRHDALVEVK